MYDPTHGDLFKKSDIDIRECTISLVPQEVAKNRKRRWSKKFPIHIFIPHSKINVYVFSPHARDKEDWFRRMKAASQGFTSKQIIEERKKFFTYMRSYVQNVGVSNEVTPSPAKSRSKRSASSSSSTHSYRKPARVQFSKRDEDLDEEDPSSSAISISKGSPQLQHRSSVNSITSTTSVDTTSSLPPIDDGFEIVSRPHLRLPSTTLVWINAMAARLCWDVWHEQRWKDWVMSRIQKKLIRVKTPSFIEQLRLTDVDLGTDMPVVKGLNHGPHLNLKGIWVYLDVVYEGQFVMTIETKMKLGAKEEEKEDGAQQLTAVGKHRGDSG